jgi:hypothetical protein
MSIQRTAPSFHLNLAAAEEGCDTCRGGSPVSIHDLDLLRKGRCPHCRRRLPTGSGVFVIILPPDPPAESQLRSHGHRRDLY